MWAGHPRIDRIVIREVQYQFRVNRCRNEEIVVKGNLGGGVAYIRRIVIREVQYQFEDNRCRNEEIIFQGSSANSVGEQVVRTDRHNHNIPTFSPKSFKFQGSSANSNGRTDITTISPLFLRKACG
ncbi:hypothetical protein DPMN_183434 [Dreissena polymorpha]|uniref:Uncharacterized protein n=1 Tax=Dreissena polymorpha TaxID=45954 RepID=A0A9D4I5G3_DREPO|nr:hypothetical protein DPMN_183434 [Dreissena polymorpha]